MKIHDAFEQNSLEWLAARAGVVTASDFDQIMTPTFQSRTGEMPYSYLCLKLAEKWDGPQPQQYSIDMDFGKILEENAIPFYEGAFDEKINRVAFITNDDGKIGCSPDGLLGDEGGIEIKCPRMQTHVKYLLSGELPKDYACQVHGSMYVTGRPWWKFMSFHRKMPPLVLTVFRDEKIIAQIDSAVEHFVGMLDEKMKFLEEINGGPPKRKTPATQPQPQPEPDDVPIP